jgi:hypothetical protein
MDAPPSAGRVNEGLRRIADLPRTNLQSEEDVKNKIVLPMLRALGYDDSDFNYERRTGRGYVDVVVERFPSGIVVETKAPRTRLDQYVEQLETYVFHKHEQDRATIAILTDGEHFRLYGVTGALFKHGLAKHQLMSFKRADLKNAALAHELASLIGRESNEQGSTLDAITAYLHDRKDDFANVEVRRDPLKSDSVPWDVIHFPAVPHILRLLDESGSRSRARAIDRKWLDEQLVGKVDGVNTQQAVSWGLIKLKKQGIIDYGGKPKRIWLK